MIDFKCDSCAERGVTMKLYSASGIRLCSDRSACLARGASDPYSRVLRILDRRMRDLDAEIDELGLSCTDPDWDSIKDRMKELTLAAAEEIKALAEKERGQ